jgi:hypothetical protein
MNTSESTLRKLPPLWAFGLVLSVIFAVTLFVKGKSQGFLQSASRRSKKINGKQLADKEPAAERLAFTENGPNGHWSASIVPDLTRTESSAPVVVRGTSALMGNEKWRNLQLTHVTLKNLSAKTVAGVQLKWFITTRTERDKILPPPGYTGLFEAHLLSGETAKVESPLVKFSRAVKHLVKEGNLEGDFLLHVRMFQVEFEDGSVWNDDWNGPKPGDSDELRNTQSHEKVRRLSLERSKVVMQSPPTYKWKIERVGPKRMSNKAREEPDPRHADWTIEDRMPMHLPITVEVVDLNMTSLLRDVEVKVTNNANKPDYFLELAIVLPENLSPDGYPIDFPLPYGREALIRFDTPTEPSDQPLLPGDSAVLRIPQRYLSGFEKLVAKGRIERPEVRKAYLMFRRLNFGDQTGFSGDGSPVPASLARPY